MTAHGTARRATDVTVLSVETTPLDDVHQLIPFLDSRRPLVWLRNEIHDLAQAVFDLRFAVESVYVFNDKANVRLTEKAMNALFPGAIKCDWKYESWKNAWERRIYFNTPAINFFSCAERPVEAPAKPEED